MHIKGLSLSACLFALVAASPALSPAMAQDDSFEWSQAGYYEKPGVNVLVFSNWYDGLFADSKISGVEIIHHDQRLATNGDVRLSATPEQWDPIGSFGERRVDEQTGVVEVDLAYPDHDFNYVIRTQPTDDGVTISVVLPEALPAELEGKAGFNLEFLPSAYWDQAYIADGKPALFPRYATSDMEMPTGAPAGQMPTGVMQPAPRAEPRPLATASTFVLAPGEETLQVSLSSATGEISLYDGRNQAQNGWYVLRSLLPAGQSGTVLEWTLSATSKDGWYRDPVVSYSQVGYTPGRDKIAVVESDQTGPKTDRISLVRINADGSETIALNGNLEGWGQYLRYDYAKFDFSAVTEPGVYAIEYEGERTAAFPIAQDVYDTAWHPTNDVFFPVQMDHMLVNEGYRVWHGASHLDDALQAPVDHVHHDLYAQGPTTDTPYEPMEHIPGLNVGGWYDAGDFDIRTQSQYAVVRYLAYAYEDFGLTRDQTQVDQENRRTDMHRPDGKPDMLQQIEHGAIQLIAQFDAVGHAIHGIVEPDIDQYTHLGDGVTKTDNLVYDASLDFYETAGTVGEGRSGRTDDRWAFTSKSSALNYGSIAALAAAARTLDGYDDDLAARARSIAVDTFAEEQTHEPDLYRHGNTTGGPLPAERFLAAAELLRTTGDQIYADKALQFWEDGREHFANIAPAALAIRDAMPADFDKALRQASRDWLAETREAVDNPYGVVITRGGWAGSGTVSGNTAVMYAIHQAYPDLVDRSEILAGIDFLLGRHPGHNLSLVSAVGAQSKEVAYGTNRADWSFIAGGVVPGVLVLKPDYPENKESWPFFWGENEYVIPNAAQWIYLANAARELTAE